MDSHTRAPEILRTESDNDDLDASAPAAIWKDRPPEDKSDPVDHLVHRSEQAGGWTLLGASKRGKSHAHTGTYREDAFEIGIISPRNPICWALAVSDGAGSCRLSRVGSDLTVKTVINFFQETGEVPSDLKKALENAVTCALISLQTEAALRQCDITELSCTLLVLLWTQNQDGPGGTALTFQAGDGLIVSIDEDARFIPLAAQDAEAFAGETHFLASRHVHLTWDERFKSFPTDITPLGFLVMTDGVADDLIPYEKNGSILVKELREILDAENWGEALVDLLGYEKRGSFDDRTLVCAFLHPPASDCGLMEASTPGHASLMEIEVEKPQAVQIGVDGESRAGGRNKG